MFKVLKLIDFPRHIFRSWCNTFMVRGHCLDIVNITTCKLMFFQTVCTTQSVLLMNDCWLCFTSNRQRGHLEKASLFTVPCEGREARFLHLSHRESNPGPSRGSPLHYRCATPAPALINEAERFYKGKSPATLVALSIGLS